MARSRSGLLPRKQPQQSRSKATVGFVLEAAAQVFGELGYAGATTNRIAERAGVSVGSLYQYFPSKDAILLALAERHVRDATEAVADVGRLLRESAPDDEGLVRALVQSYVAANGGGRDAVYRVLYDEAPRTPELRAVLGALHEQIATEVEHHLRRLDAGGDDPTLAAGVLVHAVDALVHEVVLRPPAGRTTQACVDEVIACCLGYVRLPRSRAGATPGPTPTSLTSAPGSAPPR